MNTSLREIEFRNPRYERVLIAMKGLPCTGKSEFAKLLGRWATTTVLYIDDFLHTLSLAKGYNLDSLIPSPEEAEQLRVLAFDSLCHVASLEHRWVNRCVVIKSRFTSSFELDRLVRLVKESYFEKVVVIECRMKNEHRWRGRVEDKVRLRSPREWYKAGSWKDVDQARVDCLDSRDWDDRVLRLISGDGFGYCQVRRLVLDSVDDLNLIPHQYVDLPRLNPALLEGVNYLISLIPNDQEQELYGGRYKVVQFDELRRFLLENELRAAELRERRGYLCTNNEGGRCVFKYSEKLRTQAVCGVCEERVASGEPAYACYFCILTLHKTCGELEGFNSPGFTSIAMLDVYPEFAFLDVPTTYACKTCAEGGKEFSHACKSCLFETHLKCRLIPTIINHDCHPHFLSLELLNTDVVCKVCGAFSYERVCSYGCYVCRRYYHIKCISLPREPMHAHGGHEHAMKLMYSRGGMEQEEDYWCDMCYEDMDPENWFYLCQECPFYESHCNCTKPLRMEDDEQFNELLGGPHSLFSHSILPPISFFD